MADHEENGQPDKLSPVEIAKAASNYLRGTIAEELRDSNEFVSKASTQLLKHHGTYQQDDRERRSEARVDGPPKAKFYSFMVRTAIPGGRLTSDQLLAELDLCDEVGNTTLRITTRQGLQLHGVLKTNLKRTIQRINEVQLSTLAACGDVKRNVMCTPCPYNGDPVHEQMYELAGELVRQLNPRTRAYHQIWLTNGETGESVDVGEVGLPPANPAGPTTPGDDPVEPIYGKTYLPRKFKIAVGLPGDNSVDVYANDIGLLRDLRELERGRLQRAGRRQLRRDAQRQENVSRWSRCRCATSTPTAAVDLCIAIVKVQRDFGNRADRKVARMKYLITNWGLDRFRAKVEEYFGDSLAPLRPVGVHGFNDGMGWHEQGDGRWFYGLNIENGRIKDDETDAAAKRHCAKSARVSHPPLRLTPHQSIIFCDIDAADRDQLRGNPPPSRRAAQRGLHDRSPLVDGLPGAAHVRPGGDRERARHALHHRRARSRTRKARPAGRSLHHPHDGLPERLRPAVQFRHRPGGQNQGQVHDLSRRPRARRPAQFHLQGSGADRRSRADARARVPLFQRSPPKRRIVRRLLPPRGQG